MTALPLTRGSENHSSKSAVPLSSLPGDSKDKQSGQRAGGGKTPPNLSSGHRMLTSGGPNLTEALIDPSDFRENDVPGPDGKTSGDLEITYEQDRREDRGEEAEDEETGV